MRNEAQIKKLILDTAINDERVRSVLLNGSRANAKINPDVYQDYDIVFIVSNFYSFTDNHSWTDIFGEKLIWQLPDIPLPGDCKKDIISPAFHYLMLFKDGNRIDLTIFPIEKFYTDYKKDSLTIVWLDKDNLFTGINQSNDSDYYIRKPTTHEFLYTCNEFWWISTYVAKGLLRNEITYAKEMLETIVRPMFMKLIEWKIGSEQDFSVSFGKAGKLMKRYLSNDDYNRILKTYSNAEVEENWKSLLLMTEIFGQFATAFSAKFKYNYNDQEQENTSAYLKELYTNR